MENGEVTARFAAQMLGATLSDEQPPEGTFLADLRRLVAAQEDGLLTSSEVNEALHRLYPQHGAPSDER